MRKEKRRRSATNALEIWGECMVRASLTAAVGGAHGLEMTNRLKQDGFNANPRM